MTRLIQATLFIVLTIGVGTLLFPTLVPSTHADETPQMGVQERLASLERRVAALEREVDRLSRAGHAVPTDAPATHDEAPKTAPAEEHVKPTPSNEDAITPINQVRRGQQVTLRGVVERIRDEDEFILRDSTGSIEIYIGWKNKMPVRVGDKITVQGVADDDALPGKRPDVYARVIGLPDGTSQRMRLDE